MPVCLFPYLFPLFRSYGQFVPFWLKKRFFSQIFIINFADFSCSALNDVHVDEGERHLAPSVELPAVLRGHGVRGETGFAPAPHRL